MMSTVSMKFLTKQGKGVFSDGIGHREKNDDRPKPYSDCLLRHHVDAESSWQLDQIDWAG
jgi:hypothetical protein